MIYDRHPELQSKWDKSFWARGYYVSTIGNITEEAIKNIFKSSQKRQEKKKIEVPLYIGSVTTLAISAFQVHTQTLFIRANNNHHLKWRLLTCKSDKKSCLNRVILELSGIFVKPQNSLKCFE